MGSLPRASWAALPAALRVGASAASAAARTDALVRCARPCRGPDALASLLDGAPALPRPALNSRAVPLHEPSVPRPPGTARALGHALSLASFAAGASRCARVGQAPVLPFAARKTRPTRRQTAIVPHTNRAEFGGCPSSVRRLPHHWGPELAPRSLRRRDRATPVRSPVLAPRDSSARRARTRADAVAQKSRRTPRPPPTQ